MFAGGERKTAYELDTISPCSKGKRSSPPHELVHMVHAQKILQPPVTHVSSQDVDQIPLK